MNRTIQTLALTAICAIFAYSSSQAQTSSYRDPQTIIDEGIALHDKGEYKKAIEMYATVPECSHLYPLACYEAAMSLSNDGNTDACLSKIAEAMRLGYDHPEVVVLKSSVLDDMGKTVEAIAILQSAEQKYPYNQSILYNLGVCYLNAQNPLKAEEVLLRSVRINPFHTRTHNALSKANYMMGRFPQAFLTGHMSILMSPRINMVSEVENYITYKADSLIDLTAYPYTNKTEVDRWSRMKYLLQNEAGFSKDAEYPFKPDYMVSRHAYYLFKNLDFNPADTSIYNQLYVRTMMNLLKQGWFETYINHMFTNANNKEVTQWLKDNEKKVESFFDFIRSELNTAKQHGFSLTNEQNSIETQFYTNKNKLYAIGKSKSKVDDSENGQWIYIDGYGSIEKRLTFENGKLIGAGYNYFPNGSLKQKLMRNVDEFEGPQKTYYPNDIPEAVYNFKGGKRHGHEIHYTSSGLTASTYNYTDGELSGEAQINYFNNGYVRNVSYNNDKQNGPLTETWENGQPKLKATLADGLYTGSFESYYSNGQLESKGEYSAGFTSGKWTYYHFNGKIKTEAEYGDSGKYVGTIKWYNLDGEPKMMEDRYENGLLTGSHTDYYLNGQPSSILHYKADRLTSMTSYNGQGKVIFESEVQADSTLKIKYFHQNGSIKTDATFLNGKLNGIYKRYNAHGILIEENSYMNSMQHGPQKSYHPNGKILEAYQCDSNRIVGEFTNHNNKGQLIESRQYNTKGLNGISYEYYDNGTLRKMCDYIDGDLAGRTIYYAPNGIKVQELFYDEGRETRSVFYDEKGEIVTDANYDLGQKTVEQKFANGQLKTRYTVVDNLYNGLFETWFPNGQLESSAPFCYGKLNGNKTVYNHKGELLVSYQYLYGERDGQTTWYNKGQIDFSNPFINGIDHGITIDYHGNGKVYRKIEYKNDDQTGYTEYFTEDGTPMFRLNYLNDVIIGIASPKANSDWSEDVVVDAKTERISAQYANGKTSFAAQMKNGQYNGKLVEYSILGQPMLESDYKDNLKDGIRTRYFANGNIKETSVYALGDQEGPTVRYYDNGQKEYEGQFSQGKETGEWKYYDRNGKLIQTLYFFNGEVYDIKKQ